jgi:hypothetical protein
VNKDELEARFERVQTREHTGDFENRTDTGIVTWGSYFIQVFYIFNKAGAKK